MLATRRTTRVLIAASLLTIGLAACGSDEEGTAADLGKADDKQITVYSGRNEQLVKPLLDKFTQQTGITVNARYASTAQLAAQLVEEGDKSPADVFFAQDAGALGTVAKRGMFSTLSETTVEKVPPTYRAGNGQWVGVSARARVLAYNPDQVPADQLPNSVFDLTAAQWKGKVAFAPTNASFQAFVTAIRVQHGDAKAEEFLAGLKANDPQIRDGNGKIVEDVNSGVVPVGLVNHYYLGEIAKEKGTTPEALKVKLHFFPGGDTGALVNVAGVGVLNRSATDPDAQKFVDFLLGTEAQTHFAEQTFEYPVITGVPGPAYVPALADLAVPQIDLNDLDTLDATVSMIKDSGLVP
ncbi:iron(III) transport system substrate-binding protein [Micromonospora phaseoli]|uniref:Iron(III) transport system substrate-binding protein n=1 Tax=Micromonospora phaseoli TaxID=1144548 RepID=A0A1H6S265_9ACTN|nr:iron ABC transporter substrate-binding protein [Micromonospora phaseoli]PZW03615.1 iron(III) transport system substrate-binding protein [Micromonospora phaseoli]GIJ81313.1 iron ABC transporter substrate-binding protein [Micromonospora phaseoli]SEI58130.1 iron(III) transport system substrate-binding protein [Micromonospora phaseoli]